MLICGSSERNELLEIKIARNQIKKCQGDAIIVKDLKNFSKLLIRENDITETKGNGISLSSLEQRANNIELKDNRLDYNKGHGIFVCDAVCEIADCHSCHNALKGIYITKARATRLTNVIKNCTVRSNLGSGIGLASGNTHLVVNSCRVLKNKEYGLELDCTELESNSLSASSRSFSMDSSCFAVRDKKKVVTVKYGEISENVRGGVYVDLKCSMMIQETVIKNNGEAAIVMENNKGTVEYSDKTLKRRMILGGVKKKNKEINIYSRKKNKACGVCTIL